MILDMGGPQSLQHDPPPSATTNISPSLAIQGIDQQIEHYSRIIIGLRVQRNSHQPISQLPVEVLCRIFALTQQSLEQQWCPHSLFSLVIEGSSREELSLIVMTHVCHYWRNAALNEPSLWTRPPPHYKKWTSVFLARSQMADISLSFCCGASSMDSEHTAAVLSHIPHATTLVLRGIHRPTLDQMFGHISATIAPVLEVLTIDGADDDGDDYFSLPETALPRPSLRHLSLNFVKISWNSHLLFGLTDLKLQNLPISARPTPTEFLMVLEQNPALRNLTLDDAALPSASRLAGSSYTNRRIPLQSLETLAICSEELACEFVCNHILLSERMKRNNVHIEDDSNSSRHLYKLLSVLRRTNIGPPLGSLSLSAHIGCVVPYGDCYYASQGFALSTSGTANPTPFDFYNDIPESFQSNGNYLDLQLSGNYRSARFTTRLDEVSVFFHGLRWDNLLQLDISLLHVTEPGLDTLLATTFGTLPGLRTVAVGESTAIPLLNALVLNAEKDPALFTGSITFPDLHKIIFNNITFADKHNSSSSSELLHIDALLDCLMDRYERGVEVSSVAITRCRLFHENDYGLLKEVVPDVKRDSDRSEHSEYDDDL